MKKTVLLVILISMLSACATPAPAAIPTRKPTSTIAIPTKTKVPKPTSTPVTLTGCVRKGSLRVRSAPGTDSNILDGLATGTCVLIVGRNDDASWVYISNEELLGWVSAEYVSIEGNIDTLKVTFETIASEINSPPAAAAKTSTPASYTTINGLTLSAMQEQSNRLTNQAPKKTSTPKPDYVLCKDTGNSIGSKVTCKILRAYCSYRPSVEGNPTYCNDPEFPHHRFTLLVWGSDWSDLDGDCLIVTGVVSRYDGKPQIVATSRSQVSSCP